MYIVDDGQGCADSSTQLQIRLEHFPPASTKRVAGGECATSRRCSKMNDGPPPDETLGEATAHRDLASESRRQRRQQLLGEALVAVLGRRASSDLSAVVRTVVGNWLEMELYARGLAIVSVPPPTPKAKDPAFHDPGLSETSDEMGEPRELQAAVKFAFGEALTSLRRRVRLNQVKLARGAKLGESFIQKLECGERQPTVRTIFQLSEPLGVPPAVIVGLTESIIRQGNEGGRRVLGEPKVLPELPPLEDPYLHDPEASPIPLAVGVALRAVRNRTGRSQDILAELAEKRGDTLSVLERGRLNPRLSTVLTLASAAGVTGEFLIHLINILLCGDVSPATAAAVLNSLQFTMVVPRQPAMRTDADA
jgi:transcriptional regulator with XRE-family HTH domain